MVLVSVLLCSNRDDSFFYEAVESILNQKFPDLELIIVLNGAALNNLDSIRKKISNYQSVNILTANLAGLNYSLNLGLDHAQGKYVARMDADDVSYPDRISTQYEFLENNPDIAVCGSSFNLIDRDGKVVKEIVNAIANVDIRRALFYRNPFCHPTVMFKRDLVRQLGGYQNGQFAEDYDLWVRLARNPNILFANIPRTLLGYRLLSIGEARGSKVAYRAVSTTQWLEFISTGNPKWLIASIMSVLKASFLGR